MIVCGHDNSDGINSINDGTRPLDVNYASENNNDRQDWLGKMASDELYKHENNYYGQDWLGKTAIDSELYLRNNKDKIAQRWQRKENLKNRFNQVASDTKMADMADAFIDHKKRKIVNAAKSLPRTAGRAVVGGIAGGALALTGAAVGAASGSPGDAMKYALAGAGAGYYGANYYGDKAANTIKDDFKAMEPAFWGADYKKHQQEKYDRQMRNSEEYIQAYANVSGGSRTEGKILSNEYQEEEEYLLEHANISDPKMLSRAVRLINEYETGKRQFNGQSLTREQARDHIAAIAKDAASVGAGAWESNSPQYRTWVRQRTELLQKRGITKQEEIDKMISSWFGEMAEVKFGQSK